VSPELSAIEVVGCETDEGGDLLAIDLAELRQRGEERIGEGRADCRHGDEQAIAVGETRIGGDKFGQPLVEEKNIGLQSHQATLAKTPQRGVHEMSCLVHSGSMLVTQLAPHGYDLGEVFNCIVASHNACRHNRDVFCNQSRVETIILGQDTAGASELTKLARLVRLRDARRSRGGRNPCSGGRRESRFGTSNLQPAPSAPMVGRTIGLLEQVKHLIGRPRSPKPGGPTCRPSLKSRASSLHVSAGRVVVDRDEVER
jgi:hypothetical protein